MKVLLYVYIENESTSGPAEINIWKVYYLHMPPGITD